VNLEAIASLTVQRDAAEALARETQTALVKAVALAIDNARQIDEALAILRDLVTADGLVTVTSDVPTGYVDAMDRARKLVGGGAVVDNRDPENPCEMFQIGKPSGTCEGDGHYRCSECVKLVGGGE
jgi:hypothetical protein